MPIETREEPSSWLSGRITRPPHIGTTCSPRAFPAATRNGGLQVRCHDPHGRRRAPTRSAAAPVAHRCRGHTAGLAPSMPTSTWFAAALRLFV